MKNLWIVLSVLAVMVVSANAVDEIVCNDDFGDGLRSSTGSLDMNWWQVNNSVSYNLTVADDTANS